jgi:hypothetical protein
VFREVDSTLDKLQRMIGWFVLFYKRMIFLMRWDLDGLEEKMFWRFQFYNKFNFFINLHIQRETCTSSYS